MPNTHWALDEERKIYLREVWCSNRGAEPEPNPSSLSHEFHYFVNGRLYTLSMTNDLTRRTLSKVGKHREISEEWALTRVEPLDQFAKSKGFLDTLKEAMQVSQGGNPFIAEYAHQNGWTTAYALKLEVGPVRGWLRAVRS